MSTSHCIVCQAEARDNKPCHDKLQDAIAITNRATRQQATALYAKLRHATTSLDMASYGTPSPPHTTPSHCIVCQAVARDDKPRHDKLRNANAKPSHATRHNTKPLHRMPSCDTQKKPRHALISADAQ